MRSSREVRITASLPSRTQAGQAGSRYRFVASDSLFGLGSVDVQSRRDEADDTAGLFASPPSGGEKSLFA